MRTALCLLFLLLPTSAAPSATIHVPNNYPTIQEGIDASVNGDTVIVAPGTYYENIDFRGKAIHVKSSGGAQNTIIDGRKLGPVVTLADGVGSDTVLEQFTITNGKDSTSGGIFCGSFCSPLIRNNVIEANEDHGIFCGQRSSPSIENNLLINNKKHGLSSWKSVAPSIRNNIIAGNLKKGIYIFEPAGCPLIESNEILGNNDDGILLSWVDAVEIVGNKIMNNFGDGISSMDWSYPSITGNTIRDNYYSGIGSYSGDPVIMGNTISHNTHGGIHCGNSVVIIKENVITENSTSYSGGGILSGHDGLIENNLISKNTCLWDGGGCYFLSDSIVVRGNVVTENDAAGSGGGLCVTWNPPTIENNIIAHNTAGERGGGISTYGTQAVIRNNMIYGNTAYQGGGMSLEHSATPTVTNNTFFENTALAEGGGFFCVESEVPVTNTILWGNDAPSGPEIWIGSTTAQPSIFTISFSDVEGGQSSVYVEPASTLIWGGGMIDADPLFVNPPGADFHITFNSPCREEGSDTAPALPDEDFEGDPRISQGTVDMGADEFYTHLYITGDKAPGGSIEGKFVGLPGTSPVGLFVGSNVLPSPMNTMWGEFHLLWPFVLIAPLGSIPTDGVMVLPTILPPDMTVPVDIPMQALIGLNPDSLTNLCVLEVR